jgi:hypothetical protein
MYSVQKECCFCLVLQVKSLLPNNEDDQTHYEI